MTYKIKFTSKTAKDFKDLDNSVRQAIIKTLHKISLNPELGKPLELNLRDLHSYRAGSYRVVYKIFKKEIHVLIVAVGHRREVYDKLRRLLDK
ncbi:MAG TPA: type II toxin-antitoxin system RelE/ParE family toxin [Nitrospirota bacterium]